MKRILLFSLLLALSGCGEDRAASREQELERIREKQLNLKKEQEEYMQRKIQQLENQSEAGRDTVVR